MSKVALIRYESFDYNEVKVAVQKGIGLLGGALAIIRPGENILLKLN